MQGKGCRYQNPADTYDSNHLQRKLLFNHRPWYVLDPGHRWPALLVPMNWICELVPSTGETARRLFTLKQMLAALLEAVENGASAIYQSRLNASASSQRLGGRRGA